MSILQSLLSHIRPVRKWAIANQAKVGFSIFDFHLRILVENRELLLYPRFSIKAGDSVAYTSEVSDDCTFIGWAPYTTRRWAISSDKMLFKQYCLEAGVRTPPVGDAVLDGLMNFIIKPRRSSFSDGIRGPFRPDALNRELCGDGDVREAFISGKIVKAWYWYGVIVAVEVTDFPVVYGDGMRSIGQIVLARRGSFDADLTKESIDQMLAWQGWHRDDVPGAGVAVQVDFRYRSRFHRFEFKDTDCLATLDLGVRQQLEEAGRRMVNGIDANVRRFSMFTLDAMLDDNGLVWFLEMNSNPMVHPSMYPEMLSSIFNAARQAAPAVATAS